MVTILVAVEEVNSELVGFHKSWGGYWTNNRPQDPYIKNRSEPDKGKNFSETLPPNTWNSLLCETNFFIGEGLAGILWSPL